MTASTSILADKLHEYPQQDVIDGTSGGSDSILDECLNSNDGVLQLLHRYAGRTFCTPGKRLRLDAQSYYPDYMNGTGLDELWMCCTVPAADLFRDGASKGSQPVDDRRSDRRQSPAGRVRRSF